MDSIPLASIAALGLGETPDTPFVDVLALGFFLLGIGAVLVVLDLANDWRDLADTIARGVAVLCIAVGACVISGQILAHAGDPFQPDEVSVSQLLSTGI